MALGFDLAFKYRTPAIMLADGIVGQMMEKVVLPPQRPRRTPKRLPHNARGHNRKTRIASAQYHDNPEAHATGNGGNQHPPSAKNTA